MSEEISFGSITEDTKKKVETTKGPIPQEPKKNDGIALLPTKQIENMIKNSIGNVDKIERGLNCAIFGKDGTGKTGICIDYLETLSKKSLIVDLDGSARKLVMVYHKESFNSGKIIPLNPIEMTENAETGDVVIDYVKTFHKIKAMIKYVSDNREQFSAIVLDGISDLLKYAENQMRLEKNINADGGVNYQYWKNRNQRFAEVLEGMRHISGVDKFYIGHEDFIIGEDSASVRVKTNQMMQQRILCRRKETKKTEGGNIVEFVAKIDKSKYNISLEGKEIVFGSIKEGQYTWDTKEIFKDL